MWLHSQNSGLGHRRVLTSELNCLCQCRCQSTILNLTTDIYFEKNHHGNGSQYSTQIISYSIWNLPKVNMVKDTPYPPIKDVILQTDDFVSLAQAVSLGSVNARRTPTSSWVAGGGRRSRHVVSSGVEVRALDETPTAGRQHCVQALIILHSIKRYDYRSKKWPWWLCSLRLGTHAGTSSCMLNSKFHNAK